MLIVEHCESGNCMSIYEYLSFEKILEVILNFLHVLKLGRYIHISYDLVCIIGLFKVVQ